MTNKEFDALPLLLNPRQAQEFLNVDARTLETIREGTPAIATRLGTMKHFRYHKTKLAELAGFKYEND